VGHSGHYYMVQFATVSRDQVKYQACSTNEVFPGLGSVDGTKFIRTAVILIDTLGWVDWGQPEGK